MYLHVGKDIVIKTSNIIGIFDLDTSTMKKSTQKYLEKIQSLGNLISISNISLPKSVIVYKDKDKEYVYLTPLSTSTLKNRFLL